MASTSQTMPMLSVPEKRTSSLDLHKFLFDHISSNFSSHDASASERELSHVRHMRSDLEKQRNPSPSSASSRLDLLLQYYRAICVIKRRLDCVNSIPFTWQDAFRSNKKSSLQSIDFEKAAILFNIGAVYSQIGSMTERNTEEGRKAAYVEFQKAAGVFRLLKENAAVGTTVDLTAECAGMLEILMLAQAQECMFDKAIADSKGVTLCSKVAKQAGNFYIEVYSALTLPPLDQHFDRAWVSHVQLKTAYFYAEAVSLYCIDLHLNEDIGQEIARLKLSISSLSDAKKSAKGAPSSLLEAASKLEIKMKQNHETAVKENNQIYLMQITPVNSLSELPAAVLAQPAPVEGLDMSSETLFSNLISESNKKALTKYTEMIDDVLQSQLDKIKLAKDVCKGKLQVMGLPDSIGAVETDCTIPAELKAQVEAIQDRDGSGGLQVLLRQLMDLRKVNLELTEQMEEMLQNEEKEDSQYRDQYKEKWNRPESGVLSKEIRDMISKYAENLREAGVSDLKIEQSMSENFGILAILDIQPIESALPSLPWPVTYVDGSEDRTLSTLKLSLTKLETLEAQLESLEENLKELKKHKDDILPKLLGGASLEEVLKEEKEKLNPICEEISKHIEMVEQLLLEIQDQNSKFVDHFRPNEYIISLKTLEQIPTAVAKFREIKENLKEGIKFYVSLQESLDTLKQRSSDFVMTRGMQCHEMEEILKQPGHSSTPTYVSQAAAVALDEEEENKTADKQQTETNWASISADGPGLTEQYNTVSTKEAVNSTEELISVETLNKR